MPASPHRAKAAALACLASAGLLVGCAEPGPSLQPLLSRVLHGGPTHALARLAGPLDSARRARLAERGLVPLSRRGDGWWLIASSGPLAPPRAGGDLTATRSITPADKLGPRLRRALADTAADERLTLWLVASRPGDTPGERVGFAPVFALRRTPGEVAALARRDGVLWIDRAPGPAVPLLDETREVIGAESLHALDLFTDPPSYELAGQGTVAAIWDPNGVEADHGDLKDNLLRAPDPSLAASLKHGTQVAGCLAGSGLRSAAPPGHPWAERQLRGIAPAAKVAMYLTEGDLDLQGKPFPFTAQYLDARENHGADVISLSFHHGTLPGYDATAMNLDFLIAGIKPSLPAPIPIVAAAGNEGDEQGYGSVAAMASAKNVITVGASDWADGSLAHFSSLGPTADGRTKPELVAPGWADHGGTRVGLDAVRLLSDSGAPPIEWRFDDGTAQGWTVLRDLEDLGASPAGLLEARTSGNNPGLRSPAGLGADATSYTKVEVSLRLDRHHRAELLWKTSDTKGFATKRSRSFFVNADGTTRSYTIDLGAHPEWKGTIEQLRLDPVNAGIFTPRVGNSYGTTSGTSMSAPIVAGGTLLVLQAWRSTFGGGDPAARPSPALVKALLVATAEDLQGEGPVGNPDLDGAPTPYGPGPDFATGFGELRVGRAVALIEGAAAGGPQTFFSGVLPSPEAKVQLRLTLGAKPPPALSVTLAWDDPPADPAATQTLQNDLELRVTTPDGGQQLPWLLDPEQPSAPATRGADHRNTIEQVPIVTPEPGSYVVSITAAGSELARAPQRFALALSSSEGVTAIEVDGDGDGAYGAADCDDADPRVHPGATEIAGNARDDDCDPETGDEPAPADAGPPSDSTPEDAGVSEAGADLTVSQPGGSGGCAVTQTRQASPRGATPSGATGVTLLCLLAIGLLRGRRRTVVRKSATRGST